MRKTEIDIDSHRQSAQVATSLDYDENEVEQSQRDGYADLLCNLGDKYPNRVVVASYVFAGVISKSVVNVQTVVAVAELDS